MAIIPEHLRHLAHEHNCRWRGAPYVCASEHANGVNPVIICADCKRTAWGELCKLYPRSELNPCNYIPPESRRKP